MRNAWLFLPLVVLVPLSAFCSRTSTPPESVITAYKADADRFCSAIVDCMKDDVKKRMAAEPERRDMIIKRMDRDLCIKGQYALIGQSSVELTVKKPAFQPEHYKTYSECANAVASAKECTERMKIYRELPACRTVRGKQGDH